ncbi:type IIL restriction-modification enzyme MmeI, partial [Oleidesulfovibrio alaskensis]
PRVIVGSKPIDNGNFIFMKNEMDKFIEKEPLSKQFFRPYLGSKEFINGTERWILSLHSADPKTIRSMPNILKLINRVRQFRLNSSSKPTQKLAESPTSYHINVIPSSEYIVIPKVSSERREYIPIGWIKPPTIPSDLLHVLLDSDIWNFAVLTSRMHMSWMRHIGGRLESRYRYSINLVYNTFPWPKTSTSSKEKIRLIANEIITARNNHPESSLADLYDPNTMPNDLRKAHSKLDIAIDKLYKPSGFSSDRERVEHLFALYEELTTST